MEKATFVAGCFWGVQEVFSGIKGVVSTAVGYTGGTAENPTYEQVCTGKTGHAEAIEVTFDSELVTFQDLLAVFWSIHDPTTPDRQGPDVGTQYRSAVFIHDAKQGTIARASRGELADSGRFRDPIVTEILPASQFYRAEDYHQGYIAKRRAQLR
jgi:peptide-methionine (S)-S-oxide reductase